MKKSLIEKIYEDGRISDEEYEKLTGQRRLRIILLSIALLAGIAVLGTLFFLFGSDLLKPFRSRVEVEKVVEKEPVYVSHSISDTVPQIVQFEPVGVVDRVPEILARFNRPMVNPFRDTDVLGSIQADLPIEVSPDLSAHFIWRSPYELEIVLEDRLRNGTKVDIEFSPYLKDIEGEKLSGRREFSFVHNPLKSFSVRRRRSDPDKIEVSLTTNIKLKGTELQKHLVVLDADSEPLETSVRWSHRTRRNHVVRVFGEGISGDLHFYLKKGLTAPGGNYPLPQDLHYRHRVGHLKLRNIKARTNREKPYAVLNFNHRFKNIEGIEKWIRVNGDTNYTVSTHRYGRLRLESKHFNFADTARITLKAGLMSGVYTLQEDVSRLLEIGDANPHVAVKAEGIMHSLSGELMLPVEHINSDTLYMKVYQIYDDNLVHFINQYRYSVRNTELFYEQADITFPLPGEKNVKHTGYIDLKKNLGDKLSGPKIVKFSHSRSSRLGNKMLIISDIGISYKRIDDQILVLATSVTDGSPMSGVEITVYSRANQKLARGKTDSRGIVSFRDVSFEDGEPYSVIARRGGDINYLALREGSVSTTGFDVRGPAYPEEEEIEALVYGEREIYRPGETVRLKILARQTGLKPLKDLPLKVTIRDPQNNRVLERTVSTGRLGGADLQYVSPQDGLTGNYRLNVRLAGNGKSIGRQRFQIEEFVPDRIETEITASRDEMFIDENVKFTVQGDFLYGKPASGNRVQSMYRIRPVGFSHEDYPDYHFGDNRIKFNQIFKERGEAKLDEEGEYSFEFSPPSDLKPPASLQLTMTATVFDMGARGVTDLTPVAVHPYPYYIGIRQATDNLVTVPRGGEVKFDVLGIKPDGQRVKNKELTATLYRREWRYSLRDDGRNRYRYHWTREDVPVTDKQIKISEKPARISFHIQQWGSYLIEVKDPGENVVSTRRFRAGRWWRVSGARRVDFDRLDVSFDRDNYKPGDQVKIKIDAPYDGTAYIFREDREIKYMDSVKVEDLEAEFSFEVDSSYPGNSYISVLLLRGNEDVDVNSFRAIGVTPFKVEQEDKIIEVGYKFPEPLTPGETVPVLLELRDREGRLIDGEVALSIVDQGILQLTKHRFSDPYSHFYRKRGYFIKNRDIFGMLNAEPDTGLGGVLEPSGDAPGEKAKMPDRMEPFNFVSSWYPSLEVKDGKARLQHPIPEFSGRLVMRAWAISEDKTGYARTTKNIRQPLIVRPTLPRAVAPGDEFEFPVEVTSNLEEKQVIKINFNSDRQLVIDNEGLALELEPGGRERIMVSASVKMGIGNISFDINVSGEDIDIERNYLLPVLPPYPAVNENKFRVIDAPDNREITVEPMFYPSTASSRVVVSTMPSVELLSGLRYLIRYPHGCVEQITSRVFPQLYLRRLLMLTDWDRDREDEIELNINQGISKIVSRTLPDGSFSMWPGGNSTYYHGSIYAAHFLVEARRAGYAVPDGVLKRVKNWLEDRVKYDKEKSRRPRRAYALYVLALSGEYNVPLAKKLLKEIDDYSQYYAVGALLLAGEKEAVKDYLYNRTPMLGTTERRTYGRLRSRVIAEAVALNALLEADEDLPVMDSLAANILRRAKFKNRWGSTHENAQALIALARYFDRRPPEETDFEGYIVLDGSDTLYFNSEEDTGIDIQREFKSLSINLEGTGPLYLSTTRRGIPVEGLQEEISRDMNVQHRFYDLKGNPHGGNKFKQGKLYVVQTSVKTPRRLGNLYFEDLLPGGFEIENRRIATRAMDIPFLTRRRAYLNNTEYIDVRDDRVIMYFNSRSRHNTYSFRYLVRAVTRGKFQYPPVSGGCMYDPDVQVLKFNEPIIIK